MDIRAQGHRRRKKLVTHSLVHPSLFSGSSNLSTSRLPFSYPAPRAWSLDEPGHGVQEMQGSFTLCPCLSRQACAQYRHGLTSAAPQHPQPSYCSRPAFPCLVSSLVACCTAYHPSHTQAPSLSPSAFWATSVPEWAASWGGMTQAACGPPLPPVADDAARCIHK